MRSLPKTLSDCLLSTNRWPVVPPWADPILFPIASQPVFTCATLFEVWFWCSVPSSFCFSVPVLPSLTLNALITPCASTPPCVPAVLSFPWSQGLPLTRVYSCLAHKCGTHAVNTGWINKCRMDRFTPVADGLWTEINTNNVSVRLDLKPWCNLCNMYI